jgi:amino acid transporter
VTSTGAGDGLLIRASGSPPPAPHDATASGRPISAVAFLGVAVASFGGPLALAALYAPTILVDATASAGLVTVAAAIAFGVPLLVWLRYSRHVATSGGLYSFVADAAGRRVALVQAGLWIASYSLYLIYTTASIVYDTLPAVLPGVRPYRPLLEIAIPMTLAAVMLAGRAVTLAVVGAVAAGQLLLVGVLAAVTIGHDAPASSFALHPPSGALGTATGQISLLYVCGSLPLFLGGEVARPTRTVRRGLVAGYLLAAAGIVAAVFPIAENPAFTRAPIPGMSIAEVFSGHRLAVAIGVGVAVSVAGVMLVEYLALSRLLHALTARPIRTIIAALAAVLVVSAPITLVDPERFYNDLLKPSLIALWLSQIVVFAVYPRFAARHGRLRLTDVALALGGSAFAVYGIYATLQHASS